MEIAIENTAAAFRSKPSDNTFQKLPLKMAMRSRKYSSTTAQNHRRCITRDADEEDLRRPPRREEEDVERHRRVATRREEKGDKLTATETT